jgi:hypothetical protein
MPLMLLIPKDILLNCSPFWIIILIILVLMASPEMISLHDLFVIIILLYIHHKCSGLYHRPGWIIKFPHQFYIAIN